MSMCICMGVGMPSEASARGAGVTNSYELPGESVQVLCRSRILS